MIHAEPQKRRVLARFTTHTLIVMAGLVPATHTLDLAQMNSDRGYGSPGQARG
jgi:hypothetical protein